MSNHQRNLIDYFKQQNINANFFLNKFHQIRHLHHDSRLVDKESAFIAIRGTNHDGHAYVKTALQQGSPCVFVDKEFSFPQYNIIQSEQQRIVQVEDTSQFADAIASIFYDNPSQKCQVIGITGTNGKTTVTYLLEALFKIEKNISNVGVISTINVRYQNVVRKSINTTPAALDVQRFLYEMIQAGVTTVVMEVSSHALALSRVTNVHFDKAIFLNISSEHLDFHPTMEDYLLKKLSLFDLLSKSSKIDKQAIFCLDSALAVEKIQIYLGQRDQTNYSKIFFFERDKLKTQNIITQLNLIERERQTNCRRNKYAYDLKPERFAWRNLFFNSSGYRSRYLLYVLTKKHRFKKILDLKTHFLGKFNGQNLTAALLLAMGTKVTNASNGVEKKISRKCLRKVLNSLVVPGRLEKLSLTKEKGKGEDGIIFFDYAHTPDALENVLKTLRTFLSFDFSSTDNKRKKKRRNFVKKRRLICLFGCGGDRDTSKRAMMGEVAATYADKLFITSDNPRTEDPDVIIDMILTGLSSVKADHFTYERITNRKRAIEQAVIDLKRGDVLLIAGKGHEDYQIVGDKKIEFIEKDIVLQAIENKKLNHVNA